VLRLLNHLYKLYLFLKARKIDKKVVLLSHWQIKPFGSKGDSKHGKLPQGFDAQGLEIKVFTSIVKMSNELKNNLVIFF
jgi:hypothetical protein